LTYLASRQTTEGWVTEAWLAVDDQPPVRLSEDGAGATGLALATQGSGLLALYLDARAALTAMHARTVTVDGDKPRLGEDAVVFVGGPGDRRMQAALVAPPGGPAWGLLPLSRDVGTFGAVAVRIEDPPRVEAQATWSPYPNGLDPASIAAVPAAPRPWVARIRPAAAAPSSPRVVEIGLVEADGTFLARDTIATKGTASDAALALDARGALWVGWVDAAGSWVERLACPH
jgi:hypothetical protein